MTPLWAKALGVLLAINAISFGMLYVAHRVATRRKP